jgi:hypothetical protein
MRPLLALPLLIVAAFLIDDTRIFFGVMLAVWAHNIEYDHK